MVTIRRMESGGMAISSETPQLTVLVRYPQRALGNYAQRRLAPGHPGRKGHQNMFRFNCLLTVAVVISILALLAEPGRGEDPAGEQVRLGVYDSRAIAMAWIRSKHSPLPDKMKELQQAEAAGDKKKVEQLNAWGEMLQRQLHFQGFGKYPVDEYLDQVQEKLPEIMAQHELDAIVWMCHRHNDHVTLVDITPDLMKLFGASDEVIQQAKELKKHEPLDFATLFKMDPRQ
jgi:hypothetical protein